MSGNAREHGSDPRGRAAQLTMRNKLLVVFTLMFCAPLAAQINDDTDRSVDQAIAVLRGRQADVRRAKAILERVFVFPAGVTPVTLTLPDMPDRMHGSFNPYLRIIRINNRPQVSSYAALITFHEAGHWFDNQVLAPRLVPGAGPVTFASEKNAPSLSAWHAAIKKTKTWAGLQQLLKSPNTAKGSDREAYLKYVTAPDEMWARSFCYYVARKSGDPEILADLATYTQSDWPWNGGWYPDDFKTVERAMDELFAKHGWLKAAKKETEPPWENY